MPPNFQKKKRIDLKNHGTSEVVEDRLHKSFASKLEGKCNSSNDGVCLGSVWLPPAKETEGRSPDDVKKEAEAFLNEYYTSLKGYGSDSHLERWEEIEEQIDSEGTYNISEGELAFGAKLAWRNAERCIGRIQWNKLQLFDARDAETTDEMFDAICQHIKFATNEGNLRSAITVFPPRMAGKVDFRVWNPQLIGYAGYRNPDGSVTGDAVNVKFTEVCIELGWQSKRTQWDVLPMVLSAGGDPKVYEIPPELILEVEFTHPRLDWFEELGLKWFALPAVSGMKFDCGGLEFPACPFNGWYMGTEIGCRDLGDAHRYNKLPIIAEKLGLDTSNAATLWKDAALVELNIAVLHSFQKAGVTIVDHHTASEQFMIHFNAETQIRGGCPSDWVWIVPPMSGSTCPVFHQEMASYQLKPAYEYQEVPWKEILDKNRRINKLLFKEVAHAVAFASNLFSKALKSRIKATILYATETRKSEMFAKRLGKLFAHSFNVKVMCMDEYDIKNLPHETVLLLVASTFGNGDPPENGQKFAQALHGIKMSNGVVLQNPQMAQVIKQHKSFIKRNSSVFSTGFNTIRANKNRAPRKRDTSISAYSMQASDDPLQNVSFAVFGLGSNAYPNFGAFGTYLDNLMGDLGAERLLDLQIGDELAGQQQTFEAWLNDIYQAACKKFNLVTFTESTDIVSLIQIPSPTNTRFQISSETAQDDAAAFGKTHARHVAAYSLVERNFLHTVEENNYQTIHIVLRNTEDTSLEYSVGDHIGIFPETCPDLVDSVLLKLQNVPEDLDAPVELQFLKRQATHDDWVSHDQLPTSCSLRKLLTRFLNLNLPASPEVLRYFQRCTTDEDELRRLQELIENGEAYDKWKAYYWPNLLTLLNQFPNVKADAAVLCSLLPILQPRLYSVSSSQKVTNDEIHLTISVVNFETPDGTLHKGVTSSYINCVELGSTFHCFVRSAPSFRLPSEKEKPLIFIGAGSGVAPFRGFWKELQKEWEEENSLRKVTLFFGCRTKETILYRKELEHMESKMGYSVRIAFSREFGIPKTYVQDVLGKEGTTLFRQIMDQGAHVYVCGDVKMAEDVWNRLIEIIHEESGTLSFEEAEDYMLSLRDYNRYHEDIFGQLPKKPQEEDGTGKPTNRSLKGKKTALHLKDISIVPEKKPSVSEDSTHTIEVEQVATKEPIKKQPSANLCWPCLTCQKHEHHE